VLAGGVRREEANDVRVVEGEAGCAKALRVRGEIGAAAGEPCLHVRQPVAAIAGDVGQLVEPSEEEGDRRRVAAERLLETEVRGLMPEVSDGEELERVRRRAIHVRSGRNVIYGVDDQIKVDQSCRRVGLEAACRGPQGGPELLRRERRVPELSSRAATLDRLADPTPRSLSWRRQRHAARTDLVRAPCPFACTPPHP